METIFVTRQPAYDAALGIAHFDIRFFVSEGRAAAVGQHAHDARIFNYLMDVGLPNLVGDRCACVRLSREFAATDVDLPWGPEQLAIEAGGESAADPVALRSLRRLSEAGYWIALTEEAGPIRDEALLELASAYRLDLRQFRHERLAARFHELRSRGLKTICSGLESRKDFEFVRELGCDLFQGSFAARPQVLGGVQSSGDRTATIMLLARLYDPASTPESLAQLIATNISLSYKLLAYVNSVAVGIQQVVDSIQRAVIMLGIRHLQNLAALLILADASGQPSSVINQARLRAKTCELLGTALGRKDSQVFYSVGLLSYLDALLGRSLPEIVETLPLNADLVDALLHRKGELGAALSCAIAAERADWGRVRDFPLPQPVVAQAITSAIECVERERVGG